MRLFLRLPIALVIVGALLSTQAARFLVVDDPAKSDAIVVLAGETNFRPARGLQLLRQGMASRMFFDAESEAVIYNQSLTALAQKYIASQPEADRISVCPIESGSTFGETQAVARCLTSKDLNSTGLTPTTVHRVLLVTSDYHSRRALAIFSHRLPQYQWSVAAARNPATFGDAWWRHREWAKTTLDEWMKLFWWELVDRWR